MQQFPGGLKAFFPNVEVVILSQSDLSIEGVTVISSSEKAVKFLSDKGYEEIIVGGGTNIYNEFLENDLVTDIYFNYIPVIVGDGGIIGVGADLNTKFKIVAHKLLTDSIAQLHLAKP
ncbi:dihydrofolate reductase [Flavobacterium sp. HJJ]|uniref:dihydrofolate reductase n=1 Tax=Flavobacterium sp. HJJ TaxID=2783792 RepID=UPI00293B92A2|nr:dihydrofolate reductase [Flavobacterium sp. HJJ]